MIVIRVIALKKVSSKIIELCQNLPSHIVFAFSTLVRLQHVFTAAIAAPLLGMPGAPR